MNTKSIIEIFRGDDSDALGYQTIVGTIHTDLDLTGCKAVFRYLGFFQEFDPIPEDGKLTIVIPSASSMQFPPGFGYASLKVYDIDRKVRTFTNRIPVFVKTMTPCRGGGEFDVEFSPFPELAPLKIFKGPNADDFDQYTGFISKIIDRASAQKYGLSMLFDAMDAEKTAERGCAASPAAVKAAYDAVIGVLTDNYYTAEQVDEAIDKLAAYYITSNTQGNPFATHSALINATTYYSGGSVRTPTRNDYAIVVADETHDNEEWRYIYSENEQGVGQWEPQYAVEGVITFDDTVTRTSGNGVKSSGIWSMIWGALSALPTGFTSLYDWCVAQIAKLRDKLDLNVYSFGNASVTFPSGYSITDGYTTYRPGGTGGIDETIEFYGPITSTVEQRYIFWVPYGYKDATDFDPAAQSVWCLYARPGDTVPEYLMYHTGPSFSISDWGTTAPTLTLSNGEESGGHPTMTRPLGATGDTLAKASQLAGKQDALSAQQLAKIAAVSDALAFDATHSYAKGDPVVYNGTLYTFTAAHTGAWTGTDVSAVDIVSRLAGKANDNAVVHLEGDETVGGDKAFTGQDNFYDLTISHPQGYGYIRFLAQPNENRVLVSFSDPASGSMGSLLLPIMPTSAGTLAVIENIAPDAFGVLYDGVTVDLDTLYCYQGRLYRCILGYTFQSGDSYPPDDPTHWTTATVEDVLKALRTALAGKEDASNKVTSLTAQSTDAQYPSAKCVYDALQGVDAKPTRIFNDAGTDALDDKGQLFKSTLVSSESYWTAAGAVWTYVGKSQLSTMSVQTYNWKHPSYNSYIAYDSNSGKMYNVRQPYAWESAELEGFEQTAGLNPSTGGVLSNMENVGLFYYDQNSGWGVHTTNATFTPYSETRTFSTYAHFSLESLPDRTWAAGVWAVGDLVEYSGKAYRCKAATTASDTTAPSSDTTHWEEIPVLSEKAPLASPAFTGTPTAPTPTTGDNSTKVATTAFVQGAVPYALGTAITASAQLADRTINAVTQSGATDIALTFPAAVTGKARDFLAFVTIGSGATGAVTFTTPTGATIYGDSLTQTMAAGDAWLFGITEIAANVFLVKAEKMEVAS